MSAPRGRVIEWPQSEGERLPGALLAEYLGAVLAGAAAIARQAQDAEWLGRQDAASLVAMHGALMGEARRILAAMEPGD